jgi:hypothetical protein
MEAEVLRDFELSQIGGDCLLALELEGKESNHAVMRCKLPIRGTQYGTSRVTTRFYAEDGVRKFQCDDYYCNTSKTAVVKVSINGTHDGDGTGVNGSNAVLYVVVTPASLASAQRAAGGRSQQQQQQQQQQAAPRHLLRLSGPPKRVRTLADRQATATKRAIGTITATTTAASSAVAALRGGQRQTAPLVNGTDDSSKAEAAAASARLRAAGLAALTATAADAAAADAARTAGVGAMFDRYGESLMSNYEVGEWHTFGTLCVPLAALYSCTSNRALPFSTVSIVRMSCSCSLKVEKRLLLLSTSHRLWCGVTVTTLVLHH